VSSVLGAAISPPTLYPEWSLSKLVVSAVLVWGNLDEPVLVISPQSEDTAWRLFDALRHVRSLWVLAQRQEVTA